MKLIKKILTQENLLITYKLLYDALLLILITFSLTLLAEGMLPGIVSAHISMARIAVAVFLVIGAIVWIGSKLNIVYNAPKLKRNGYLPALIIVSFLLIGNSMLRFALWENIAITLIILLIFFLFYDLIFSARN